MHSPRWIQTGRRSCLLLLIGMAFLNSQSVMVEAAKSVRGKQAKKQKGNKSKQANVVTTSASAEKRFKKKALLKTTTTPQYQKIQGDSFVLDGQQVSLKDENLLPVTVASAGITAEPVVFQAASTIPNVFEKTENNTDDIILVSKVSGIFQGAIKIKKGTGELIQLSQFDNETFISFSTNDLDENELKNYTFGEDTAVPDFIRRQLDPINPDMNASYAGGSARRILQQPGPCPSYTVIRIALRYDSGYCAMFGDNGSFAEAYLHFLVATINEWYKVPGLCKEVQICNIQGFCNGAGTDVFRNMVQQSSQGVCYNWGNTNALLSQFTSYSYPNNRFPGQLPSQCDVAHLVYGNDANGNNPTPGTTIGCAWVGAICNNAASAVEYFGFTNNHALHATLIAHELGHNLGAQHWTQTLTGYYIMEPYICPCSKFDPPAMSAMDSMVARRASATCTAAASAIQTVAPTSSPTHVSTHSIPPTSSPTNSAVPSRSPTRSPTVVPSAMPSSSPSKSSRPSSSPAASLSPSSVPSSRPSQTPVQPPIGDPCNGISRKNCRKVYGGTCNWIRNICQRKIVPPSQAVSSNQGGINCAIYTNGRSCRSNPSCTWNKRKKVCK